jgi:predicted nucleic acid-binding protein
LSGGAFDATMLIFLFNEKAPAPLDPSTGKPLEGAQARIRHVITRITNSRGRIIVPAPALGELLVKTAPETAVEYLALLGRAKGFRIAPFGERAAIEFAEMQRQLHSARERRLAGETRAKAKFDQQIVAIARVEGATTVFSDDDGLRRYAERFGLTVEGVADLRIPPARDLQQELPLEPPEAEPEKSAEPV